MSIAELFGIKQCSVNAESCNSIEDLFVRIRYTSLDAGKPEICRKSSVIAFPALDSRNQVQIYGENGHFTVIRSSVPADSSIVEEDMLDEIRKKLSEPSASIRKLCMKLCERTADQINEMQL